MKRQYYIGPSILSVALIIMFDQLTKWMIATKMTIGDSYIIIPNFLSITSHRNNGAAWGILSGKMTFFYIVTIVILIALIYFYIKEAQYQFMMQLSLSLLFAGAIGNFIDRLLRGEVIDFIDTFIFGYDFPIFNIADSSLTVGVILLIIVLLRDTQSKDEVRK
ncbi:signal peptidase II [Staphylococcus canis]|uniref:Lipoprotein signal peptidase n=1 Tax=Staphylococcus canis TaxID=2724942 RepID=A0ABS0T9A6_9STAP|nr:signal peptidase II [Staphylococcus canis]MBI5974541.1 signal peptidase II [Staphylococcus canis]